MKLSAIFVCLILPSIAVAQGSSTGESYLKFLYPARVLSMGEAAVADPSYATTSFVNPACLVSAKSPEIMFSQLQWIQDIQTQLLHTTLPLSFGTVSLGISSTSVGGIEVRDVPGPSLGTFSAHFTTFQLGYGTAIFDNVSVGTTVKYLYDKLYVDEASGFGLDFGGLYKTPLEGLTVGFSLTNFGKMGSFRAVSSDLPSMAIGGVNYQVNENDFDLIGDAAVSRETNSGTTAIHVGGEATYSDLVSLRIGYRTGYDARGISAGLGIRYSLLQLDYAYVPFSQGFGDAHVITVAIRF